MFSAFHNVISPDHFAIFPAFYLLSGMTGGAFCRDGEGAAFETQKSKNFRKIFENFQKKIQKNISFQTTFRHPRHSHADRSRCLDGGVFFLPVSGPASRK